MAGKNRPVTERRSRCSKNIDTLSTEEILQLMNVEDKKIADAVGKELPAVAKVVEAITHRMKDGGRLIYVGTGTSGRLGIMDAVECVPTFGVEAGKVIGILAGGKDAFFSAIEGLEDDYGLGAEDIKKHEVVPEDSVVGISASGETPYVVGAVDEANKAGALTVGLVCSPGSIIEKKVDHAIVPITGPEIITGSTRLKAGTAQKMVLNLLSTTVMIGLGKVYSNLMVDVKPSNRKLKERAKEIFMLITGSDYSAAERYLEDMGYNVKIATICYLKDVSVTRAEEMLEEHGGLLHRIIRQDGTDFCD